MDVLIKALALAVVVSTPTLSDETELEDSKIAKTEFQISIAVEKEDLTTQPVI